MAERRMFAKTIVTSDAFLDMPLSARCLYFTLGMLADDDGFVNNPKSIMRQVGASQDDLNLLLVKRFILSFESGVIVIKHWRIHNYIRNDRYKETQYMEEKSVLCIDEKGAYTEKGDLVYQVDTVGIPLVSKMDTQVRLSKDSIGQVRLEKDNTTTTNNNHSFLQSEEFKLFHRVCEAFRNCGAKSNPEDFIAYNEAREWKGIGGESVLDNLERYVTRWEKREIGEDYYESKIT